jgi:MioC protein
MSSTVGIFVATMTGTAEMCADEIEGALSKADIESEIQLMDGRSAASMDPYDTIIVVTSTYGIGDVPDNGQAFYKSIEDCAGLAGKRYAVFGLGDMTYAASFCEAGRKFDTLFESKGATRFAPFLAHDASGGELAEDVAGAWATEIAPNITSQVAEAV